MKNKARILSVLLIIAVVVSMLPISSMAAPVMSNKRISAPKVLLSFVMATRPKKISYEYGEELDLTGISFKGLYSDFTKVKIDLSDVTVFGFDNTKPGYQKVVFSYGGKQSVLIVRVRESQNRDDTDSIEPLKVGDYITMGVYEQDNNLENGKEDIEWQILEIQDNKALVISRYGLDALPYNTELDSVTWETCTLRSWLGETFYNEAFDENEKSEILTTNVKVDAYPKGYKTTAGKDTEDKVFLLSFEEVDKYFKTREERLCGATDYARAQGAFVSLLKVLPDKTHGCNWWLRSTGAFQIFGSFVNVSEPFNYQGYFVSLKMFCVRPAMWITLE